MRVEQWLSNLAAGNTPHGVLLTGPAGSGKKTYALQGAALYLKGTADTKALRDCPYFQEFDYDAVRAEIEGDKSKKIVDELRKCCANINRQAFGAGRRCLYIPDAHRLNESCQNALLKTLEEPPEGALLLLTGNETGLLSTVRSRCMTVRVESRSEEEIRRLLLEQGFDREGAAFGAALSNGIIGQGIKYAGEEYRTFYKEALPCIEEALFGITPFSRVSELVKAEENKKKKLSPERADDFCGVLLRVLRESLPEFQGTLPEKNGQELAKKVSLRFTRAQIQGMIYQVLWAQKQLFQKSGTGQVLDLLLLELKNIQNR